jgi:hypothetical protein
MEKDISNAGLNYTRKNFDDVDYINNFNCTFKGDDFNMKKEFEVEKDIEDVFMINSHSQSDGTQSRKMSNNDNFLFDFMCSNNFNNNKNVRIYYYFVE